MNNQPIGVFDSGVGGLSVWKEIVSLLPKESTVYIGDSLHAPYGKRTPEEIVMLSKQLVTFLLRKKVKLIVNACNTSTLHAIDMLRAAFPEIHIIGTIPVVKTAAEVTKNKSIGVLATSAALKSAYIKRLINTFENSCNVTTVGTDVLVPFIEKADSEGIVRLLEKELQAFIENKIDTLVLGSTHFPFIKKHIAKILGEDVMLLDSGAAIAKQVKRVLENNYAVSQNTRHDVYTTGPAMQFTNVAKKLLKKEFFDTIQVVSQIKL